MTDIEKIYKDYFSDVYFYIRKLSGDEHIAEEITSETFFRAMKAIGRFRGDCDVRVWLCSIAKNCYYTYLKKSGREVSIDCCSYDPVCNIESGVFRSNEISDIKKILENLPERYKTVFSLRIFGEYSFRRIGEYFNKTENWACVTYYRAKNMIKEEMERKGYDK